MYRSFVSKGDIDQAIGLRAATSPDEMVVRMRGRALNRFEFESASDRAAHKLLGAGVRPGDRVLIRLNAGLSFCVTTYACVKLGLPYVPVRHDIQAEQLRHICSATCPSVIVDSENPVGGAPEPMTQLVFSDAEIDARPVSARTKTVIDGFRGKVSSGDPVYVLFTSGTTGMPKGVQITRQGLGNLLNWQGELFALSHQDVFLQRSEPTFDFSISEFWLPLVQGGVLEICPSEIRKNPQQFIELMDRVGVTVVQFVPTVLEAFLNAVEKGGANRLRHKLKLVNCNGEPLADKTRRRFYANFPSATLFNQYGPTEATVAVTSYECPRDMRARRMVVGHAMPNNQIHIVDEDLRPVPAGETGEVFISGIQVANGYVGTTASEATRFCEAPPMGLHGYLSGDLGRETAAGIELVGRKDHQVKFRGNRIELDGIAAVMTANPGVHRAVVQVHDFVGPDTKKRSVLVAAVSPSNVDTAALKAACRVELPSFAVPGAIIAVDEFPTTTNGKLDAKAVMGKILGEHETDTLSETALTKHEAIIVKLLETQFGVPCARAPELIEFDSVGIDSLDRASLAVELASLGVHVDMCEIQRPNVTARELAASSRKAPVRYQVEPASVRPGPTDVAAELQAIAASDPNLKVVVLHASVPDLIDPVNEDGLKTALIATISELADAGMTIAVPAFTPSFARSKHYHFRQTVSESGMLATWMQDCLPSSTRLAHPIYSYQVIGPGVGQLSALPHKHPFGEGSAAEWFEQVNATIIGLGTDAFTQTHRLEYLEAAPHHRRYLAVQGQADFGTGPTQVTADVYIRDLDYYGDGAIFAQDTTKTRAALGDSLRKRRIANSDVEMLSVSALDLKESLTPLLRKNPMQLLANPEAASRKLENLA